MRKQRLKPDIKVVGTVGYTSAGKSALSNKLMNFYKDKYTEEFETEDLLLRTLDTTLRKCTLPNKKQCLVTGTVGFIKDIPTDLIEAFESTLLDLKHSDLILFVLDSSSSDLDNQITTTIGILKELKVLDKPMVTAFNEPDKNPSAIFPYNLDNKIKISAFNDGGIEKLLYKIQEELHGNYKRVNMKFDYNHQNVLDIVLRNFGCENVSYNNDDMSLEVEIFESEIEKYKEFII